MFLETNDNKLDFIWLDKKKHTITITNNLGEDIDIKKIKDLCSKTFSEKKTKCEDLYYLGIGLEGNSDIAFGFVMGWIIKTIKDKTEETSETKWTIKHEVKELEDTEYRSTMVDSLRKLADYIEENKDATVKSISFPGVTNGPTDLF